MKSENTKTITVELTGFEERLDEVISVIRSVCDNFDVTLTEFNEKMTGDDEA